MIRLDCYNEDGLMTPFMQNLFFEYWSWTEVDDDDSITVIARECEQFGGVFHLEEQKKTFISFENDSDATAFLLKWS